MDALSRPIFIVAPPQSGTTYLYYALERAPGIRTIDAEQRKLIDLAVELDPALRDYDSNRRTADDAPAETVERLRAQLLESLSKSDAEDPPTPADDRPPRLLDATPRHALRVPFLAAVFPDASFVYVYRDPRHTLPGMLAAWESESFVTYPNLPGWQGPPWSMLLIPGWRELADKPLAEIVGEQWLTTTRTLLDDLETLSPERWCVVDFAALSAYPARELARLCEYLGVEYVDEVARGNPRGQLRTPDRETQQAGSEGLAAILTRATGLAARAHDLIAAPASGRPRPLAE